MNASIERFNQHPLQASLGALHGAIQGIEIAKWSGVDGEVTLEGSKQQRSSLARLIWIARFISTSIKRSRGLIWTTPSLESANAAVVTLTTALEQYQVSKSVSHFEAACDTALDQWRSTPLLGCSATAEDAESAFLSFCERAEAEIGTIEELKLLIREKAEEITEARDQFLKQIAGLESQIKAFETVFEQQKTRVDELVTTQQQAFQAAQTVRVNLFAQEVESRKSAHERLMAERAATFEAWIDNADKKLASLLNSTQEAAATNLAEMDKHQARAKEILGIVAASGVSGHYKNTAKRELISAEVLRALALGCFLVMGILIYHVVDSLKGPDFRWEMGLFRVGVGLALAIPAFYCAKESAKHREAEKRNRRLQIELATIEPYLEKLNNPTEMQKILTEKANSYFMGQLQNEPVDDSEGVLASKELRRREDQVVDILKALASSIKK